MPLIRDTAYPRLAASPGAAELACFAPTPAELAFVTGRTRRAGPRLALLVLLKTFQHLGYFVLLRDVPAAIVDLLADSAGLADAGTLSDYDNSTYRSRLMALVREFVGVSGDGRAVRRAAVRAGVEAARVRDEIADIINAVIEDLIRQRFELPAFGTLLKIANTARAAVNRGYHRQVSGALAPATRDRLNGLLVLPPPSVPMMGSWPLLVIKYQLYGRSRLVRSLPGSGSQPHHQKWPRAPDCRATQKSHTEASDFCDIFCFAPGV